MAGTTVAATKIEAATAKLMVKISSLNSRAMNPPMNKKGNTATRLVLVEANRADSTAWLLAIARSTTSAGSTSRPLARVPSTIASIITIELSTTIPTPRAKPPKLKTLIVRPQNRIKITAAKVASGIEIDTIRVWRRDPKKIKTAKAANPVPIKPEEITLETAF